jgi:hypothetical protein
VPEHERRREIAIRHLYFEGAQLLAEIPGVRPIMRPAMKTVMTANMIIP